MPHYAHTHSRSKRCIFRVLQVNNNTVHNWASLDEKCDADGRRRVRPIMFVVNMTSSSSTSSLDAALMTSARGLGWTLLEAPRVSKSGLPYVKEMYFDVAEKFPHCTFYAMSNGDILFNGGLVDSLDAIAKVKLITVRVVM